MTHRTTFTPPIARRQAMLVLASALALGGCTTGRDGATDGESAQPTPTDASSAPEASDGQEGADESVLDEDAPSAGVDLTAAGDPVAEATVPATVSGDPEATMNVALHSLEWSGETVVAIFSFRVDSSKNSDSTDLYNYLGMKGWHPYAIDTVNLNRHGVIGQSANRAQTAYQGTRFAPGQTLYGYAMFTAPPQDVTTMDVSLIDGAPLATAVTIE